MESNTDTAKAVPVANALNVTNIHDNKAFESFIIKIHSAKLVRHNV